jgi:hypothetical protein
MAMTDDITRRALITESKAEIATARAAVSRYAPAPHNGDARRADELFLAKRGQRRIDARRALRREERRERQQRLAEQQAQRRDDIDQAIAAALAPVIELAGALLDAIENVDGRLAKLEGRRSRSRRRKATAQADKVDAGVVRKVHENARA